MRPNTRHFYMKMHLPVPFCEIRLVGVKYAKNAKKTPTLKMTKQYFPLTKTVYLISNVCFSFKVVPLPLP